MFNRQERHHGRGPARTLTVERCWTLVIATPNAKTPVRRFALSARRHLILRVGQIGRRRGQILAFPYDSGWYQLPSNTCTCLPRGTVMMRRVFHHGVRALVRRTASDGVRAREQRHDCTVGGLSLNGFPSQAAGRALRHSVVPDRNTFPLSRLPLESPLDGSSRADAREWAPFEAQPPRQWRPRYLAELVVMVQVDTSTPSPSTSVHDAAVSQTLVVIASPIGHGLPEVMFVLLGEVGWDIRPATILPHASQALIRIPAACNTLSRAVSLDAQCPTALSPDRRSASAGEGARRSG